LGEDGGGIEVLEARKLGEVDTLAAVVGAAVERRPADDRGEEAIEHLFEDAASGLAHSLEV
jgi:hypothetical protein